MPLSRRTLLAAGASGLVVLSLVAWRVAASKPGESDPLVTRVKTGDFRVTVTTTGELRAVRSVQVQGPASLPQAQIYQPIKIASLVPEGTVVKTGDLVAELDRGAAAGKLNEVTLNVQKAEAQYTQAQLDSTLNLSKAREELRTLEFALEEKRIAKEQAQYEAPSVKRQADIDLEKATRALAQAKRDYETKKQQAIAKMSEVGAEPLGMQGPSRGDPDAEGPHHQLSWQPDTASRPLLWQEGVRRGRATALPSMSSGSPRRAYAPRGAAAPSRRSGPR